MAETGLRVVYDGPALQNNRMDVRTLSPALLDLASLFQEASLVLDPDSKPISLQVEATATGSFDVHLVIVQDIFRTVVDLFTTDTADALLNLKEYVIGGALGCSDSSNG